MLPKKPNKKFVKSFLLCVLITGMFFPAGCSRSGEEKSIQYQLSSLDGMNNEFLRQWLVLGPFPKAIDLKYDPDHGKQCTGFYADFLANAGGEQNIRPVEGNTHITDYEDTLTWRYHKTSSNMVNFNEIFSPNDYTVAYAYSEIVSPDDREILFALGSDDGIKVWVNGDVVHENHRARGLHYDQDRVVVKLKAGNNRVLVKVDEGVGAWGFALRLESRADAFEYAKSNPDKMWQYALVDYVIPPGDTLSLRKGDMRLSLLPEIPDARLTIEHSATKYRKTWGVKFGRALKIPMEKLPMGLYSLTITSGPADGSVIYQSKFYHGDTQPLREYYPRRFEPYLAGSDRKTEINITAVLERLKVLYEYGRDGFRPRLNYRLVELISEMDAILGFLEAGEEPFKHRTGTHIRGYYSAIDDTAQYYQVYVPDNYDKNRPMPVVIHLHGIFGDDRPFHKSIPLDRTPVLRTIEKHARDNGFIAIWPHGRGNAVYKGIGRNDFFAVLNEVKNDYNVDKDRIYLTGYSYGGSAALEIASQYPHLFAAVAPIAAFTDYRLSLDPREALHESDRKWRDANNIIRYAKNLAHVPVFIQHGDNDNYCDLKNSTRLYDILKSVGNDVRLKIIPGANHFNFIGDPLDSVYQWFKDKQRVKNPEKVFFSTSRLKYNRAYWLTIESLTKRLDLASIEAKIKGNTIFVKTGNVSSYGLELNDELLDTSREVAVITNGRESFRGYLPADGKLLINLEKDTISGSQSSEGPISEIFAAPFALVPGTAGTEEQKRANLEVMDNFLDAWKGRFFTNPRIIDDVDIGDEEIDKYNLILLGGPESNLIARKIIAGLPIALTDSILTFGGKSFRQTSPYGLQLLYPNPLNGNKLVLLYARSGWEPDSRERKLFDRFMIDAWYDFLLFDSQTRGPASAPLIGFFDSNWQINDALMWSIQELPY